MKRLFPALIALLASATLALAAGVVTNGLPTVQPAGSSVSGSASLPLTGNELLPADTQLGGGALPQSEAVSVKQLGLFSAPITSLTDGATISTDASLGNTFAVTLGGNRTLANPTNMQDGQVIRFLVTQDGTGSRTLTYGADFSWPGGTAPTLTITAGHTDMLICVYRNATTKLLCTSQLNYS